MSIDRKLFIKIGCGICIVFVIVVIVILLSAKSSREAAKTIESEANKVKGKAEYDEETELYYIKDEETGRIIAASYDEEGLQFYIDNPDYNSNPLEDTGYYTLEEYLEATEIEETEIEETDETESEE